MLAFYNASQRRRILLSQQVVGCSGPTTYPEWNIEISKHINGLLISQRERTYLARKWQITSEVQEVIDTALSFGLTHLWQKGHPSKG